MSKTENAYVERINNNEVFDDVVRTSYLESSEGDFLSV